MKMKMVTGGSCALLIALTTHGHALKAASSCESLSSLRLPNTSITLAQTVLAGAFTLPGTGPAVPQFSQLPAFCRVAATLTPSSDSDGLAETVHGARYGSLRGWARP